MAKYPDKKGLVCAMALLPDKSSEVYELMFSILKNKLGEVKVTQVVCDFERAVLNTVKQEFPQVDITGCLFHSRKAIWTHISGPEVGLKPLFVDGFTCCTLSAMFLQMMLFLLMKMFYYLLF